MRFAFGAGGTGGHIIPALALAKELKAAGHECFFIGNKDSMEE
ncbi:MAG: glycosyltransferase, partial [Candidatus Cloacimonetes bacterium]|nr:glycosyltransferase [Candidatus Cloacimonadota bacterium]